MKKIFKIIYTGLGISSVLVIALLSLLMKIYDLSPETTQLTWMIVIAHGIMATLIWPLGYAYPVVFRSAGDAKFPMLVSMMSMILCHIALSYVFALRLGMGMPASEKDLIKIVFAFGASGNSTLKKFL